MAAKKPDLSSMISSGIERIAERTMTWFETQVDPTNRLQARAAAVENSLRPRQTFMAGDVPEIPENELLQQAEQLATEQMTGAVPEDVQREIERITAEMSSAGGVGPSQFASNITAEALGLTSYDIANQGANLAVSVAQGQTALQQLRIQTELGVRDLNMRAQMFDEEMTLRWAGLSEQAYQWDQKFDLSMKELDLNARALQLRGLELISNNQLGMNQILAELIINDSNAAIPGLQGNIDDITSGVLALNDYISEFIEG